MIFLIQLKLLKDTFLGQIHKFFSCSVSFEIQQDAIQKGLVIKVCSIITDGQGLYLIHSTVTCQLKDTPEYEQALGSIETEKR